MREQSTQHPSQRAGQARHTHLHRVEMTEGMGLIISALFLTWEEQSTKKRG